MSSTTVGPTAFLAEIWVRVIPPNPIPTAEEKVEGVFGKWHENCDLNFDLGFGKIAQGPSPGAPTTRCARQNWRGAFLRSGGSIADDIFASRKEKKKKKCHTEIRTGDLSLTKRVIYH
jgi:hypothetical protein